MHNRLWKFLFGLILIHLQFVKTESEQDDSNYVGDEDYTKDYVPGADTGVYKTTGKKSSVSHLKTNKTSDESEDILDMDQKEEKKSISKDDNDKVEKVDESETSNKDQSLLPKVEDEYVVERSYLQGRKPFDDKNIDDYSNADEVENQMCSGR